MKKNEIKTYVRRMLEILAAYGYDKTFKRSMKTNKVVNKHLPGEDEWVRKWTIGGHKPNRVYYRLFSSYIGQSQNIVPQDICHNYVELILDPYRFVGYYADKNIFDKLLPNGYMPKTVLRKITDTYCDSDYKYINDFDDSKLSELTQGVSSDTLILKPTVGGMSGRGVELFKRENNGWFNFATHLRLNVNYLNSYEGGGNFILQEGIAQLPYMAQFNPTSVNTLRLSVYRSVKDNEAHITGAAMRIGKNGSVVDNACAGGAIIGIDALNGKLCKNLVDIAGHKVNEFNGIDFSVNDFTIPHWDNVIAFGKSICDYLPHCRLITLDICLDSSGTPKLLEFNVEAYNASVFQFTTGPAFGNFADEIIEYCKDKYKHLEHVLYL